MTNIFTAFDYVSDGICVIDSTYTVLFWNISVENYFNISRNSVLGKKVFEFYPKIKSSTVQMRLNQVFTTGMPVIFSNQLHGNLFTPSENNKSYNKIEQHVIVTGMPSEEPGNYFAVFNIKDISELSEKISAYKKARKETLLEIENRKKIEIVLKSALRDKEFLIREVHHRVKNNLALISSLIELQKHEIDNKELRYILEDLNNRIRSITIIHEKLYKSSKNNLIDIQEYLSTLVDEILISMTNDNDNIVVNYQLENIKVKPEIAIPLGLITTEIVVNSIKYGFKEIEQGVLDIRIITEQNRTVVFDISDNGPGFPGGMEYKQNDSLGFRVIEVLSMQIGATHSYCNNNGAKHHFTFELTEIPYE